MGITGCILVIDDEAALRQTLTRILQRAGYVVTSAASGKEGLAYLGQEAFDLVYLDIRMPDMNGLEALKAIRKLSPNTPVILFTAQPDLNSAIQAMRDGAVDYLLKPIKPQTLIERTQAVLARQQKEKHRREIQTQIETLQARLTNLQTGKLNDPAEEQAAAASGERYLSRGNLHFDLLARRLTIGKNTIMLPPTSFDYLLVLARHSPNVVDYQTLVAEAQGYQADLREAQELVKWHIHHIRQAIEPDAAQPTIVLNVRGTGYRLLAD